MLTRRIVIIEDELEVAESLKEYFESHGFEAAAASTGEKGLELIVSHKPHLVILDLRLGSGLSGLEVLRRAKAAKSDAEIIVVSAVNDLNVADMARGLGASGYLTKPFVIEELERLVVSQLKD